MRLLQIPLLLSLLALCGCGEKSEIEQRVDLLKEVITEENGYGQEGLDRLVVPNFEEFMQKMRNRGDSPRTATRVWQATLDWAEEIPIKEYQSVMIEEFSRAFTKEEILKYQSKSLTPDMRPKLVEAFNNARGRLMTKHMNRLEELQERARKN